MRIGFDGIVIRNQCGTSSLKFNLSNNSKSTRHSDFRPCFMACCTEMPKSLCDLGDGQVVGDTSPLHEKHPTWSISMHYH